MLICGMAAVLHGSPVVTLDCDIAVAFDKENRTRIVQALVSLHPRPLRGNATAEWDEKSIVAPWTLLDTDAGEIDLVIRLQGIDSFDGLFQRSSEIELAGQPLRYASLEDLIAMKRAAGRAKDKFQLEFLTKIDEQHN